jgi:hypothetical protein
VKYQSLCTYHSNVIAMGKFLTDDKETEWQTGQKQNAPHL